MKFIEIAHPEGGRMVVHLDHLTSAHFKPAEGEIKTRLGLDLDNRQNDITLFGAEAERVWQKLQTIIVATE